MMRSTPGQFALRSSKSYIVQVLIAIGNLITNSLQKLCQTSSNFYSFLDIRMKFRYL